MCLTSCAGSGGGGRGGGGDAFDSDTLSQTRPSDPSAYSHSHSYAASPASGYSGAADEEQDELAYFARYLAAGLRRLPRATGLLLRHRVLQLLHEAELAELQRAVRYSIALTHKRIKLPFCAVAF